MVSIYDLPDSACRNCRVPYRYGVLWAYGYEGENIRVEAKPPRTFAANRWFQLLVRSAEASRIGARCSPMRKGGGACKSAHGRAWPHLARPSTISMA